MRVLTALVLAVAVAGAAGRAAADDVHVDADTSFQAYEVRSPGTAALMTRRRLVQTLGATWSRELSGGDRGEGTRPRIDASFRLRLDQDFGDTCLLSRDICVRATDAREPAVYQPLASDTDIDAPEAWVGVTGLPMSTSLRAGRQLRFDPAGMVRFDGARARFAPLAWLSAEAWGGAVVRRTSLAGSPAFEPEGAIRIDLTDEGVDPSAVPFVAEPTVTWTAGAALALGHPRWVQGRIGFRETFEEAGLVARRGWVDLASGPASWLRLAATGVLDPTDGALVDASGRVTVRPVRRLDLEVAVERHLPRFDQGTVWAYFDLVPIHELRLAARFRPSARVELGAAVRGRRADFGGDRGHEQDVGGEGRARVRLGAFRFGAEAFVWGGDLGPVAAFAVDLERPLGRWLRLRGRASVWHFDDPLRAGLYGTSVSEAAGLALRLSEVTEVVVELEHAHSRVVGHRFRGLAALHVEVWR